MPVMRVTSTGSFRSPMVARCSRSGFLNARPLGVATWSASAALDHFGGWPCPCQSGPGFRIALLYRGIHVTPADSPCQQNILCLSCVYSVDKRWKLKDRYLSECWEKKSTSRRTVFHRLLIEREIPAGLLRREQRGQHPVGGQIDAD